MLAFLFALLSVALAIGQPASIVPETVVVPSGKLHLKAFLWKPDGPGPFPTVLFNHGSCRKACATVFETWLRISLFIPPRTRPFSRPRAVHARHLAARRSSERQ